MPLSPFYYRESFGMRITVRPMYLRDQSEPSAAHYVFAYFVRIENVGNQPAQLMSRRWLIHDSVGEDTEVKGEGVVGEQPLLAPGQVHEYQSFCILKSGEGYMEGHYNFVCPDSTAFRAEIPRFVLSASASNSLPS
ncbi:MAG TPA: Co2+/Mg2+ efflux protein ApaG [Gemmatimonadaceae bacterium]|nr:Co2+/Mg2+ efflux protein ApaG [Gemmatimonadaceae bacterium]